jgi:hypothetical protein
LTFDQKTIIQKSDHTPQVYPKVMNFVELLKIQFCIIVPNFKLNPLILKIGFGSKMENPHR